MCIRQRARERRENAQAPRSLPSPLVFFSACGGARTGGDTDVEWKGWRGGGGRAWTGLDSVGLRLGVRGGYLTGYGG